jgi:hypothetical protein
MAEREGTEARRHGGAETTARRSGWRQIRDEGAANAQVFVARVSNP